MNLIVKDNALVFYPIKSNIIINIIATGYISLVTLFLFSSQPTLIKQLFFASLGIGLGATSLFLSIFLAISMLHNMPRIEINLQEIRIVQLFFSKFILWDDIAFINEINGKVHIGSKKDLDILKLISPKEIKPIEWLVFLTRAREQILNKSISSLSDLYAILQKSISEYRPTFDIDKKALANEFLNTKKATKKINYLDNSKPYFNSENQILMLRFPSIIPRYTGGIALLGIPLLCYAATLHHVLEKLLFIIIIAIVLGIITFVGTFFYNRIIFIDLEKKLVYRGFEVFGKIYNVEKVLENFNEIVLKEFSSRGALTCTWVSIANDSSYVYCKMFITRYFAKKLQLNLVRQLKIEAEKELSFPFSNLLYAFNRGSELMTIFILSLPYIGLLNAFAELFIY